MRSSFPLFFGILWLGAGCGVRSTSAQPGGSSSGASSTPGASSASLGAATQGAAKGGAAHADWSGGYGKISLPPAGGRPKVPGFSGATSWLNVDRPLDLEDLRGKVVVVDFWTSCCINCIHTLPTLGKIEARFRGAPVVVVGVHSPKFDAETENERLRTILAEYRITHPVAVDSKMQVWESWGVHSWPSIVVIDAAGRAAWTASGEPSESELGGAIASAVGEADRDGSIVTTPVAGLHPEAMPTTPLAFPSKVIGLSKGGYAVSDTGHDRIVFFDEAGKVTAVAGSGLSGSTDGGFGDASFRKPNGLAEVGGAVYVADTENHLLRKIDRLGKTVTTAAGTGTLGAGALTAAGAGTSIALRSPWDLIAARGVLYVALAGSHQIATFDPKTGTLAPFAGDGRERRKDGSALTASFAQPSGLATDGTSLFVADSETSSIRSVDLASGNVKTIVGKDLFVFGDIDGDGGTTRLEHPIGLAASGGRLYVADTYNSKIKKIDPGTGNTTSVLGGRDHALFADPNGLAVTGDAIVVADTHHSRLVKMTLGASPHAVPFELVGLAAPSRGVAVAAAGERSPAKPDERLALPELATAKPRTGEALRVHVAFRAPEGTGVNDDAPFRMRPLRSEGLAAPPGELRGKGADHHGGFELDVIPAADASRVRVVFDLDLVTCDVATHAVCIPLRREVDLSVRFAPGGAREAEVSLPLPAATGG